MKKVIFGQLGRLKREKIDEYVELHASTWPGVLQTITVCHLQNYSIFLHDDLVFGYYEYTGDDYDADMKKMADDPVTQEWWKQTHPCFEEYSIDPQSEYYHDMKPIFYHP
jgi:L-rhamnose mutarotase